MAAASRAGGKHFGNDFDSNGQRWGGWIGTAIRLEAGEMTFRRTCGRPGEAGAGRWIWEIRGREGKREHRGTAERF